MNKYCKYIVLTFLMIKVNLKAQNCTPTISGNNSICNGDSTILVASGATNYSWSPSYGLNNTTGASVSASPTVTTQYTITATTGTCVATNTVLVTINPKPAVSVSPSYTSGCAPFCVTFSNTAGGLGYYNWNWGNGTVNLDTNGQQSQYHCYMVAGSFTITLTVYNGWGCKDSSTAICVVNNCSGIENEGMAGVKVFPNPGNSMLNIESNLLGVEVEIYDVLGNEIQAEALNYQRQLDISRLPPGVYFLLLHEKENKYLAKFIKE